jgi:hypothetical protein
MVLLPFMGLFLLETFQAKHGIRQKASPEKPAWKYRLA